MRVSVSVCSQGLYGPCKSKEEISKKVNYGYVINQ